MKSFTCQSCKIDTPIDQDNHNGFCFTCANHDKQQLRKLFDTLKSLPDIEFKTDTGKVIQTGLQGAWNIVTPWIIELSHRIK